MKIAKPTVFSSDLTVGVERSENRKSTFRDNKKKNNHPTADKTAAISATDIDNNNVENGIADNTLINIRGYVDINLATMADKHS